MKSENTQEACRRKVFKINTLIEKELVLTPKDSQKNIPFVFQLNEAYERLVMTFEYGPSHATEEESFVVVKESLKHYFPFKGEITNDVVREFLPVENLVTVSLSYNGEYLGARHTKERTQKIVISENGASLGFPTHAIRPGEWEIQLNAHCVASTEVTAKVGVYVEGVKEDEPIRSRIAQPHPSQ